MPKGKPGKYVEPATFTEAELPVIFDPEAPDALADDYDEDGHDV